MNPPGACLWVVLLFLICGCGGRKDGHGRTGPMAAPAYWVWHRSSPLSGPELQSLREAGVRRLYWQAIETTWNGRSWNSNRLSTPQNPAGDLEVVPVFRLNPESAFLAAPDAASLLARQVYLWSGENQHLAEIQIDFDCPDRLLGEYAEFLTSFGKAVSPTKVSITALAAWPGRPNFNKLAEAVVSLAPMFYDLHADAPADVMAGIYQTMADPAVEDWIRKWSSCPRPWIAGLANFERVSAFDGQGRLIGHLRGWTHDSLFFNSDLRAQPQRHGITVFHPDKAIKVAGLQLPAEGRIVHRMPEISSLSAMVEAANQSGAAHVIYFALPGPGINASYSPSHLAHPETPPRLLVKSSADGSIRLENQGPTDVPAGIWELELESQSVGAFRSASPGAFVESIIADALPAEHAGRVLLRFSRLPAGQSLESGALLARTQGVRWRLRGLTEMEPLIPIDSSR